MANYISEKPYYSENLDNNIQTVINKILEMQKICAEIHTPLKEAIHDHQWYHYNSEGRRAFDALGLVEHDIYLFSYYISLIAEKVWKLYYEENPEEIPAKYRKETYAATPTNYGTENSEEIPANDGAENVGD